MVHNGSILLREAGVVAPSIHKKMIEHRDRVDYFAPELKTPCEYATLDAYDKTDLWSIGILYYYLLTNKMPVIHQENGIDLTLLNTSQKNINVIGKCLNYSVQERITLQDFKIDGIDETLLAQFIQEEEEEEEEEEKEEEEEDTVGKHQFLRKRNRVFKHYHKILAQSSTSSCRLCGRTALVLLVLWVLFFGQFFVNGGIGLLKSNYYRSITLQVITNYGTSLTNMTILTTDGTLIQDNYSQYSYEQFTQGINCYTDPHSHISAFINGPHAGFCFSGFLYAILISLLYALYSCKLDLPTIATQYKKTKDMKRITHYLVVTGVLPSLLFTFYYIYALEYTLQTNPCLGTANTAYPPFTSIHTLLKGNTGQFFYRVMLTTGVWGTLILLYAYLTLLVNKINLKLTNSKALAFLALLMLAFTLICRVGFGRYVYVVEPTWTNNINQDLVFGTAHGLLGMFPQITIIILWVVERGFDLVFWFFLKMGLRGEEEEDIQMVKVVRAKYEPINANALTVQANMIERSFEVFE